MLRASHTTRDLPCVKVSVEVQLGVSVCNFYIGQAKVVEHIVQIQYVIHICCTCVLL